MGSFKPATSDGGVSAAVWANGCGHHLLGAVAGRLCRFLLEKNCVEQAGAKNFRRIVLVLVFLIGLTTLGKFVGQISR